MESIQEDCLLTVVRKVYVEDLCLCRRNANPTLGPPRSLCMYIDRPRYYRIVYFRFAPPYGLGTILPTINTELILRLDKVNARYTSRLVADESDGKTERASSACRICGSLYVYYDKCLIVP